MWALPDLDLDPDTLSQAFSCVLPMAHTLAVKPFPLHLVAVRHTCPLVSMFFPCSFYLLTLPKCLSSPTTFL